MTELKKRTLIGVTRDIFKDQLDDLNIISAKTGTSVAGLIREGIDIVIHKYRKHLPKK